MKSQLPTLTYLIAASALIAIVGCEQAPPPRFQANMVTMVSTETSDPYQQEIANVLAGMFGTPDKPYAFPESGLNQQQLDLAAGSAYSDQEGVSHGLYRKHCVHCHGISGDGRGPTARFLNPYPRDYRQGVFKFKTTYNNGSKPTDDDLHRVMVNGIPGTAMPSFSLLPGSEVESLIEYVKYLAIRGEMEQKLADFVYNDLGETEKLDENGEPILDEDGNEVMERIPLDPASDPEQAQIIKDLLAEVVLPWQEAADSVVVPVEEEIPADDRTAEVIAASVAKGRELFYGTKANCFTCHGPTGLGDGQQTDFDNWNKELNAFVNDTQQMAESLAEREKAEEISEEEQAAIERDYEILANRQAVADTFYPIRNAIPRNLRKGVYRGGRRRIDIFSRIHQGIAGTPMPGVGSASPGAQGTLTEAEIWNLVDYVLSLPYEELSNPQPALTLNEEPIAN
ncbi:MAG TPA: c-type cytochrome [Lacipirellula sp.]